MDLDWESKFRSLILRLVRYVYDDNPDSEKEHPLRSIICHVNSLDVESQPKPETKLMSLITQAITLFKSMDFDSQPEPLSKLISILGNRSSSDSYAPDDADEFLLHIIEATELVPEPKLMSLIFHIVLKVVNSKNENLIYLCPKALVEVGEDNIPHFVEEFQFPTIHYKWSCLYEGDVVAFKVAGEGVSSYFFCRNCKGQIHERATNEIKHPLHSKHSLQLVFLRSIYKERKCYCCDEGLVEFVYCCFPCNFMMNESCARKPIVKSRDHLEWHEHALSLFPRKTPVICNLCGLDDPSCPFYICPPCDFSTHQSCLSLPHVIKISRHPHRISFTPSFDQKGLSCGVCRKTVDEDNGGYSCIRRGCSYAAHSLCATQSIVWDGKELEGVPEETEEVPEPFVRISGGVIRHFSHEHHHMRLDENTEREYDENKQCQACLMPIYFGNFYSCMECDFILHEVCANLSRKIDHPIHPHPLTLAEGHEDSFDACWACTQARMSGFIYKCDKEGCDYKVHVKCGVISEPLVHGSHTHPLFLTCKPAEFRRCHVCKSRQITFNCIECDFSLCYKCATIPQKVRYKHDKHVLFLSYGNERSTVTSWCEGCERKIDPDKSFYTCDEYCCVTLHVRCVIGSDFFVKPGESFFWNIEVVSATNDGYEKQIVSSIRKLDNQMDRETTFKKKIDALPNNRMSRPICRSCRQRCYQKVFFQMSELIFCSIGCALLDADDDAEIRPTT